MPLIVENKSYQFWVTKSQFGLIVAAMPLGALFSCVISAFIRHKFGTKMTILIFAMPATCGSIFVTFSLNLTMVRFQRSLFKIFLMILVKFLAIAWKIHDRLVSRMLLICYSNLCW